MHTDPTLTPYERKRWKQLRRQLETGKVRNTRPRWLAAVAVTLALLVAAVLGGGIAAVAVAGYLIVSLALWSLYRAVRHIGPPPEPLRDLL